MNNDNMGITISGGKLPMTVLVSGLTAIIITIIYSTVWLTKLDDRVVHNAVSIAEMQQTTTDIANTLSVVQSNCAKQTFVLDSLVKTVDKAHP